MLSTTEHAPRFFTLHQKISCFNVANIVQWSNPKNPWKIVPIKKKPLGKSSPGHGVKLPPPTQKPPQIPGNITFQYPQTPSNRNNTELSQSSLKKPGSFQNADLLSNFFKKKIQCDQGYCRPPCGLSFWGVFGFSTSPSTGWIGGRSMGEKKSGF